jgi:UPF0176 protein
MLNVAGYLFIHIDNPQQLVTHIRDLLSNQEPFRDNVKGTILIAPEGINMFLTGEKEIVQDLFIEKHLYSLDERFKRIAFKYMECETHGFSALRVRLKKEVISMGHLYPELTNTPDMDTSDHITPSQFKEMLDSNPDVQVFDTRNVYEVEIGKFNNAKYLPIDTFRDFPQSLQENIHMFDKNKPLVMYCTGGVRCEKAAPYLRKHGFEQVYQLGGGILKYLMDFEQDQNEKYFEGECFVYDKRVAVAPKDLTRQSLVKMCKGCMNPVPHELQKEDLGYKEDVICPNCPSNKQKRKEYALKVQ